MAMAMENCKERLPGSLKHSLADLTAAVHISEYSTIPHVPRPGCAILEARTWCLSQGSERVGEDLSQGSSHGFLGLMNERRVSPTNSVLSQVPNKQGDEISARHCFGRIPYSKVILILK